MAAEVGWESGIYVIGCVRVFIYASECTHRLFLLLVYIVTTSLCHVCIMFVLDWIKEKGGWGEERGERGVERGRQTKYIAILSSVIGRKDEGCEGLKTTLK